MASDQDFVDFVIDQINMPGEVTARKMFGDYGLFYGKKIFGLICDNKLFIKRTHAGSKFRKDFTEASPYPGAKPIFLIEDKLEDRDWLTAFVRLTLEELPEPKPKKKKTRK